MSFAAIKSKINLRLLEIDRHLIFIQSQESLTVPPNPVALEVKIMRGLYYVHQYSSIEYSINELIQQTLLLINSYNIQNCHYTTQFNTISIFNKVKSLKNCGHKNFIQKSIEMFSEVDSVNITPINETIFATYLQNIWTENIVEVISAFGMSPLNIDPRTKSTIDEIVDKRNAVAHGRENAQTIGERHNTTILRNKYQIIYDLLSRLIAHFENYYNNKEFLKAQNRVIY